MIVKARAPAKAILVGEHFVVYGGYALAVPITLWARVRAERCGKLSLRSFLVEGECGEKGCPSQLKPFYEMLRAIAGDNPAATGCYEILEGSIPVAAGLGSSAATAVALAAAALKLGGEKPEPGRIRDLAMISEKIVHGKPSGVDPTVSSYGRAVLFSPSRGLRLLNLPRREKLLVCCSGGARSTAEMIRRVAAFREKKPELFSSLLESSSELSAKAAELLERGRSRELAPIIRWHHRALRLMGVSTSELEELVSAAERAGYAAKLTGAGGGGCVIGVPAGNAARPPPPCFEAEYPAGGVEAWTA